MIMKENDVIVEKRNNIRTLQNEKTGKSVIRVNGYTGPRHNNGI